MTQDAKLREKLQSTLNGDELHESAPEIESDHQGITLNAQTSQALEESFSALKGLFRGQSSVVERSKDRI